MKENQRQKQKRETRGKILAAAMIMFAERGFSVTTTEIAQSAGISHGSIFVHFTTREELIDCAINVFFDHLNQEINIAAKGNADMEDLLEVYLSILHSSEDFYRNLITQISLLPDVTQEKLFAYQTTLSFHFDDALRREKEQGKIVALPHHMLFNMWLSLVHYYLQNRAMFAPEDSVIDRYRDELISSYLMMIRKS